LQVVLVRSICRLSKISVPGNATFAAVEWGLANFWSPPGQPTERERWSAALNATFAAGDCRLLAIYNWDGGLANQPQAQAGLRDFVAAYGGQ
jgi:hypothetical protein